VVAQILAAAMPDLTTRGLKPVASNEEFDSWAVGTTVVKFPRSEEHAAKVSREQAMHLALRGAVGEIVPDIVGAADPTGAFPFPFLAYERARGRPGQTSEGPMVQPKPWARSKLAGQVATAFGAVHAIAVRSAKTAGVPVRAVEFDPGIDASEEAIAWARKIAGNGVDDFLMDPLPVDARAPAKGVLCHGDVKGEHLFVSEDGTRLTAIVDWADLVIADPAVDLAGLVIWLGPGFVGDVVDSYLGPKDEGTVARAVFLARLGLLNYLDEVLARGEQGPERIVEAQLRAAFSTA